ncbi:Cell division protein FtsN [Defluviimonas aquaemixtae]|uniref:Cell division protein FtsN n=1 Tax=Albidovulum aquaemixtae TaxID=1542388 RepID=A0A2R8B723_9RHOB|nr:SPOR domain-containing protein [Defluviimonas aquaemixtae]SPH18332.1 Cell division protein FtsN [Defluviimonas aquaemixtae]
MADAKYDDYGGYGPYGSVADRGARGGGFQKWVNGAGALTSVALIVGLGVWTYNLAIRDVRGIPVIRALEGPARVAPDNPGGELAMHQGMAVNEVAAAGTAGEAADQLTLAPTPGALAEEDQPMGSLEAVAEETPESAPSAIPASADPAGDPLTPMTADIRPGEPLPDGPVEPVIAPPEAGAFVAPDVIATDIPGVSRSLRPLTRPATGAEDGYDAMAEAAAAAVAAALAEPVLDVSPDALGQGTRLVQIGAYPDEAEARLEWDKVAARFGGLMEGKRRVIEPATTNGETFYRLRVEGFSDLEDARRFCAALKAENTECVPAMVR